MASTLRPFRDYDEKDVINLYAVREHPIEPGSSYEDRRRLGHYQ